MSTSPASRRKAVALADLMFEGHEWNSMSGEDRLAFLAQFAARHVVYTAEERNRSPREVWEAFRVYMDRAPWDA